MTEPINVKDEVIETGIRLWHDAQVGVSESEAAPSNWGNAVHAVYDHEIADEISRPLAEVRAYLDALEGTVFALGRDGAARTIKAVVTDR